MYFSFCETKKFICFFLWFVSCKSSILMVLLVLKLGDSCLRWVSTSDLSFQSRKEETSFKAAFLPLLKFFDISTKRTRKTSFKNLFFNWKVKFLQQVRFVSVRKTCHFKVWKTNYLLRRYSSHSWTRFIWRQFEKRKTSFEIFFFNRGDKKFLAGVLSWNVPLKYILIVY